MKHISRQEKLDMNYRKVEAMYRKDLSITDMKRQLGLDSMDVLDIAQKIFAMDQRRMNRA